MQAVVGHEWAVELLARSVAVERTRHAYLFVGPAHVGKGFLARMFAQMLLCERSDPPCGSCRSCRLIQADRHPDVLMVAPSEGTIKIEAIRELQHALSLAPVEGAWRICIILDAETATVAAANSMLKTLEEPPGRVILVLTATHTDLLLPTLVSRCQIVGLRPVPTAQIVTALRERGVARDEAQLLGSLADGRVGWALEAAQDRAVLERREQVLADVADLAQGSYTRRFAWAERQSRQPELIPDALAVMSSWWRDVLLLAVGSTAPITNVDRREQVGEWAARFGATVARSVLQSIHDTAWKIAHNANVRLALEVLALDMPGSLRNGS